MSGKLIVIIDNLKQKLKKKFPDKFNFMKLSIDIKIIYGLWKKLK